MRMVKMRGSRLAAIATGLMLVLSGCSTETETVVVETPAPPAAEGTTPAPAEPAPPAAGGETACPADTAVNIGLVTQGDNNVQTDNPLMIGTGTGNILGYNRVMFEPIAVINRLDPTEVTPWLASNIQWNDEQSSVTITARDGINWSDGTPFTADDIAATFETMREFELVGEDGTVTHPLDTNFGIGDIDVDGNQVTLNFVCNVRDLPPNADGVVNTFNNCPAGRESGDPLPRINDFQNVLNQRILQRGYLDSLAGEDILTIPMNDAPITGPYEVASFTGQQVVMHARDDYWGGAGQNSNAPAAQTVNYVSFNDNNALETALQAGGITWSQSPFSSEQAENAFANASPYNVVFSPSDQSIEMMYLNTERPPFDDVVLRKAANMVINREAWRAISFNGQGDLLTSATGLLPSQAGFLNPALANANLTLDVAGAQEMLREAGYQDVGVAGQLKYPNGDPVVITISAPSDWSDYVSSASMIVQSLTNDLGADAEFIATDVDTWWGDRAVGDFDAAQRAAGTTGPTLFFLYRDMIAQPGMGGWAEMGDWGDWNLGRFRSETVADAFQTMLTSPDPSAREQALWDIQQVMIDEAPVLLLGGRPIFSAYSTSCFTNWPSDANRYAAAQVIDPGSALMILTSIEHR